MNPIVYLFSSMTILYAEDEEGLRHSVTQTLELFFKKVIQARDGEEAIDLFFDENPDILLLDICMPKLDGLSLLKQIRQMHKRVPVIIMSAHTDQNYLLQAVELNICKYLIKPFSKDQFLEALEACADWMYEWGNGYSIPLGDETTYNPLLAQISKGEITATLTKKERLLFEYFLRQKNRNLSFEELEDALWGNETKGKEALKAMIKELRKKIPQGLIENIFGVGYKCVLN